MLKRGKKAQTVFGMSFGMIFSIIIIIAILIVGFYVITFFLNLNKCTQVGLFFNDIEETVNEAWGNEISHEIFEGELPTSIKKVCIGNLSQSASGFTDEQNLFLEDGYEIQNNIFLIPPNKACDGDLASFKLKHAKSDTFHCIDVIKGKVEIQYDITKADTIVTLSAP